MDKRVYTAVCLSRGHLLGSLPVDPVIHKDYTIQQFKILCLQCGGTLEEINNPPKTRTRKKKGEE